LASLEFDFYSSSTQVCILSTADSAVSIAFYCVCVLF